MVYLSKKKKNPTRLSIMNRCNVILYENILFFPVAFMLSTKNEVVLVELIEMLTHYLENKGAKDQMFLVFYESRRADLLYCVFLEPTFSLATRWVFEIVPWKVFETFYVKFCLKIFIWCWNLNFGRKELGISQLAIVFSIKLPGK